MEVKWDQNACSNMPVCVLTSLPNVFKVEDGNFVIDPRGCFGGRSSGDVVCEVPFWRFVSSGLSLTSFILIN